MKRKNVQYTKKTLNRNFAAFCEISLDNHPWMKLCALGTEKENCSLQPQVTGVIAFLTILVFGWK